MSHVPVHRQKTPPVAAPPTAEDFTYFPFPYDGLEVISHVHPRFVICCIGQVLGQSGLLLAAYQREYPSHLWTLIDIFIVYSLWTSPPPALGAGNDGDNGFDYSSSAMGSNHTPPKRVYPTTHSVAQEPSNALEEVPAKKKHP